ncbi:hypothetical protein MVEG_04101 [Podila verticillata NRRL 6337]|nr:hypothetical protein MVEG_04101 [Podila verticillata NRRL 6337]
MRPPEDTNPSVIIQKFQSEDGEPLGTLRTLICEETGESYILWKDIQEAFMGIGHLDDWSHGSARRVLFLVDKAGELLHNAFSVVFVNICEQQAEETCRAQLEIDESSSQKNSINHDKIQGKDIKANGELMSSLNHLFDTCTYIYEHLKSATTAPRETFQYLVANSRYFYSTLAEEVERLDQAGAKAKVNGKDQTQIMEEIGDLERQVPDWDYRNICHTMVAVKETGLSNATSNFFIVLPLSLDSWDDHEPSSHQFRLYFLCENCTRGDDAALTIPQHVHLSNHPGYGLKRPQEFLQSFGDYVLRILLMIKRGYSDNLYEIPPLDTFNILWRNGPNVFRNHINNDTIEPLVNKTIAYLQELSPPKWTRQLWLSRTKSAAVKTFLDVPEGDNADGNLYRYTGDDLMVSWRCEAHAHQYVDQKSLAALRKFVHSHGGHVDTQQATLSIELATIADADQFQALLSDTKHRFDYSVKLSWRATRPYAKDLFLNIGKKSSRVMEIDGITPDIHPLGYDQYRNNLFRDEILSVTGIYVISLLNYPRPQQQTTHFWNFSIQSVLLPTPLLHGWVHLDSDINEIEELVCKAQVASDCDIAANELKVTVEKHRVPEVTAVTLFTVYGWNTVFDLEKGSIVELQSKVDACPKGVLSSGSLRTLGLHLSDLNFDQEFFRLVQINTKLQEVNISHHQNDILHNTEHIIKMWHMSASPFRLLLLDRRQDTQGQVVAELAIRGEGVNLSGNSIRDVPGRDSNPPSDHQEATANIAFLQWSCDEIGPPLSDYLASILDMATQQHPSTLTLFTLDVSQLSQEGLSAVQNILRRSQLEFLHVVCAPFDPCDPSRPLSIPQVLDSVQWSTIKSLVLSGHNIDVWIKLWTCPFFAPQLLCLQIQGTGSSLQELSQLSVRFILRLIYLTSTMTELHLANVQLQDKRDWELIVDSVDPLSLKTFSLCAVNQRQLMSVTDAAKLFDEKFPSSEKKTISGTENKDQSCGVAV